MEGGGGEPEQVPEPLDTAVDNGIEQVGWATQHCTMYVDSVHDRTHTHCKIEHVKCFSSRFQVHSDCEAHNDFQHKLDDLIFIAMRMCTCIYELTFPVCYDD